MINFCFFSGEFKLIKDKKSNKIFFNLKKRVLTEIVQIMAFKTKLYCIKWQKFFSQ